MLIKTIIGILHLLQVSEQFGVGVLALLDASVERVVDAVELVPHVRRARLHQRVHVAAQFHRELALLPCSLEVLLRELLPTDRYRQPV